MASSPWSPSWAQGARATSARRGAHRVLGTPNGCYPLSGFRATARASPSPWTSWAPPYPEIDYAGGLPGGYDDPAYQIPRDHHPVGARSPSTPAPTASSVIPSST